VGVLTPEATVAERLRRASPGFAPAERRVVRALLTEYPLTGLEPLAVVAERAGTSAPTVLRVVGKLGFSGYPDFQRALRAELAARWSTRLDVMPREPATGLVATVREAIRGAVAADLHRLASEPDMQAAAELLADARHAVWALGGRFSGVLAEYLALHLQVLRPRVHRVAGDPGSRHTALLDVARRDVVVVFDYRRHQRDTVEFGRRSAVQGARLILFTDHLLSPLAGDADVVLVSSIDSGTPFSVMSPALAAVETVLVSVVDRLGGAPQARVERYDDLFTEVLPTRPAEAAPDAGSAAGAAQPPATPADPPAGRTR
jgi:DNA-binding MurR/RpiR family transcriptional regulator